LNSFRDFPLKSRYPAFGHHPIEVALMRHLLCQHLRVRPVRHQLRAAHVTVFQGAHVDYVVEIDSDAQQRPRPLSQGPQLHLTGAGSQRFRFGQVA